MKIALIRLPATYSNWYKHPILGISYISAYMETKGYDCKIFDAYFNSWSEDELIHRIKDYNPDITGITAMTHEVSRAAETATQIKKQLNTSVIIGGCHITAMKGKTLEEFPVFDYGVYGEGENTVLELLSHLQKKSPDLTGIAGLVYRDGGYIRINKPRPNLTADDLDNLPYPAYYHYYGNNQKALAGKSSYYVMFTSRGCPYNCAFCMQVLGRKVRRRSIKSVISEINYAISTYGAHTFDFADEIFLFGDEHSRNLLQAMIEDGLQKKIRWRALTRVNFVSPDLIALAKKAGCYHLEMGVESGDDEILKTIGKGITVEQVKKSVSVIQEAGISLMTYYILGHPKETMETLKRTVDLAVKLNTSTIAVGIMVPYPGTKIYDMALRGEEGYRLLSQNWSDYDKYGGHALEIKNLPYEELAKWQRRTLMYLFLKNFRFLDAIKYFWKRHNASWFFAKRNILKLISVEHGRAK